jgi:hypothetical protein
MWRCRAKDTSYFGQDLVPISDLDGDCVRELITSSYDTVAVLSGATGEILWRSRIGTWLGAVAVPDLDGDGAEDVAVMAYDDDSRIRLDTGGPEWAVKFGNFPTILSGRTGRILWSRRPTEREVYGDQVVGVVDRNADGRGEVLCLGFVADDGRLGSAAVFELSGADGRILEVTVSPHLARSSGGFSPPRLISVGTEPGGERENLVLSGGKGQAWLIPGGRWESAMEIDAPRRHPLFAHALARVHDLNGDGVDDLLATGKMELDQGNPGGFVWAYSGIDGAGLPEWSLDGGRILPVESGGYGFGARVAALGDVDADGTPDYGVAAVDDWLGSPYPGAVIVFSGRNRSVLTVIQ